MDLSPYLGWLVFLHVLSVFLFAAGHGVSLFAAFRLKQERDPARVLALLDMSRGSLGFASIGLLGILLFGILAGIAGDDWGHPWLWVSLALFIVIGGVMTPVGAIPLNKIRTAMGQQLGKPKPGDPAPVALPMDQVGAMLDALRPDVLAAVGGGGFVVILFLMMFKPF
jgi:hypothetical protein